MLSSFARGFGLMVQNTLWFRAFRYRVQTGNAYRCQRGILVSGTHANVPAMIARVSDRVRLIF